MKAKAITLLALVMVLAVALPLGAFSALADEPTPSLVEPSTSAVPEPPTSAADEAVTNPADVKAALEAADQPLISQLQQQVGGVARIARNSETGRVSFIGTDPEHALPKAKELGAQASSEQVARSFLGTYGKLFGLKDQSSELTVKRQMAAVEGGSVVRFQQRYKGIPVLAGELNVQLDKDQNVLSANGEILPDLNVDVTPKLGAGAAKQNALAVVAKSYKLKESELEVSEPELWIFNQALLGGPGARISVLVWRMEVTPKELKPIRELVLVDAQLGATALHFNQVDTARNRLTYDAGNTTTLPGTLVCNESNPNCTGGDAHEVAAHKYAGSTYNMYWTEHARDSINGAGMTIKSTVHYSTNYVNAFWNGSQMVYGDGAGMPLEADVVGHELTHGVTQYESGLFYYYQSGAINESFSDVWGEFVDQNYASDGGTVAQRWLIGEQITGLGAIRSMKNPPAYGDPDRMTSPYYFCSSGYYDQGGVHTNSGVNNKAVYLMVDGGTFNGKTVTGLGYPKVADLYYKVQKDLLTSGGDYADLYNLLQQAAISLGFTSAQKASVKNALDAVEMGRQPNACAPLDAPMCPAGMGYTTAFFDNMETVPNPNWTHAQISGADRWYLPEPSGWSYATSGVHNMLGYDTNIPADYYIAMNSSKALPAGSTYYLRFNHAYEFEYDAGYAWPGPRYNYDGGVVEYSINAGATWVDAGALFDYNGYNGVIVSGTSNPLGGRPGFTAESYGYGSSRLNLTSLAGQSVRFRFRVGTDISNSDYGWFIDDVRIYKCVSVALPAPSNLAATAASKSQINLSWKNNATDASNVHIERRPSTSSTYVEVGYTDTASATTYSDKGLACNTTYYYRLRAHRHSDGVYSSYSVSASAKTLACAAASSPGSVSR